MAKNRNDKKQMSEKQLEKYKLRIIRQTADLYQMIALWALHNSEGYAEKRLTRVLTTMDEIAQDIIDRRLNAEDIRRTLEEETGLKFLLEDER